jgi:hypothetical protein
LRSFGPIEAETVPYWMLFQLNICRFAPFVRTLTCTVGEPLLGHWVAPDDCSDATVQVQTLMYRMEYVVDGDAAGWLTLVDG